MNTNRSALSARGRRTRPPPISWLMRLKLSRPELISLAAGFTDDRSLPVQEVRRLTGSLLSLRRTGEAALQYGSTQGDPELRKLTARHLARLDSASAVSAQRAADRLIITNGSQQTLYMLTEALCDPGDLVLVEDPTYFVYLGIVQSLGLQTRTVRLQPDGLDLAHLESVLEDLRRKGELRRLKLLYLVSYFQNPTGITTSFEKKSGALRWLRKYERQAGHPIYLVEDAAYRELQYAGVQVPSTLSAESRPDRVIYAGTYSKPFATGIRVGFGIFPEPVLTAVLGIKGNHDFGTSNLLQHLLVRALKSGVYDRHLGLLRRRYARKAEIMRNALRRHFPPEIDWQDPAGGLYFWARLPQSRKTGMHSRLFESALKHKVLYVPGELCYAEDSTRRKPNHEMRLSFGGASDRDIREGIRRLAQAL